MVQHTNNAVIHVNRPRNEMVSYTGYMYLLVLHDCYTAASSTWSLHSTQSREHSPFTSLHPSGYYHAVFASQAFVLTASFSCNFMAVKIAGVGVQANDKKGGGVLSGWSGGCTRDRLIKTAKISRFSSEAHVLFCSLKWLDGLSKLKLHRPKVS